MKSRDRDDGVTDVRPRNLRELDQAYVVPLAENNEHLFGDLRDVDLRADSRIVIPDCR